MDKDGVPFINRPIGRAQFLLASVPILGLLDLCMTFQLEHGKASAILLGRLMGFSFGLLYVFQRKRWNDIGSMYVANILFVANTIAFFISLGNCRIAAILPLWICGNILISLFQTDRLREAEGAKGRNAMIATIFIVALVFILELRIISKAYRVYSACAALS